MTLWPIQRLGDIADEGEGEIRTGPFGSQLHRHDYTDSADGVSVVMPVNMIRGRVDSHGIARVLQAKASEMAAHITRLGDVLLSRRGDIGRYCLIDASTAGVLCGTGSLRVSIQGSALMPEYFCLYLETSEGLHELQGRAIGSTMPNINSAIVRSLEVPVPPLPIQRKIVAVLYAYDDLIENNNWRIGLLEETAQRIYHEWFVDLRYPGHEAVPLVDSDLGLIPEGWVVSTLDDVCARITDGAHHSPATMKTGMPMASVKDMTPRSLEISTCRLISQDDYESLVRQDCRPRSGDVLVSKDGANFLKHVFPLFEESLAVLLSSVAILRPSDKISSVLLSLSLRQPTNKERLKGFVSGAAIPRVVLKDFKLHKLLLPARHIQRRFDEICTPMLRQAVALENCNRNLRATRDLLLPRLISGEIDVSDLDIAMREAAA